MYCYVEQRRALSDIVGYNVPCTKKVLDDLPYNHEVLTMSPELVAELNALGGLRVFSFSDFRLKDAVKVWELCQDAHKMGLKLKFVTKLREACAALSFMTYPGQTVQISTDYEHAGGLTAEFRSLISNAMTIEEACDFQATHPETFRIRYVAVHPQDVLRAARDPRISVVTAYHGYGGAVLPNVVRAQTTDTVWLESMGPWLDRILEEWVPMNTIYKRVRETFIHDEHVKSKLCCRAGVCDGCGVTCGFSQA
jgi:hypothetical protein